MCSVCDPAKTFWHPSLVIYLFWNPTHKTERGGGALQMSGTTNSKPPGPIIMIAQSETLIGSQVIFSTLFSAGALRCSSAIYCAIMLSPNCFDEPNKHILTFLHPILLCTITYLAPLEMHLNINFKYPISVLLYFLLVFVVGDFYFNFFEFKKIGKLCQKKIKIILKLLWENRFVQFFF